MMKNRYPRPSENTDSTGTLNEFARVSQQEEELKRTINRLLIQLERSKHKTEDLVNAVYRAAHEAASSLILKPVKSPPKDPRKVKHEEKALVLVSDLQLGKATRSYNTEVCEQRMNVYADKIISITNIQRKDHPVREARVYLLGDLVEGEVIFKHQPYQIDASLFKQMMVDGPRILSNFLNKLLLNFDHLHVVGIIGNHGRLHSKGGQTYNPESNADRMLYFFLKELYTHESRITWDIPYEKNQRAWYSVDYPYDKGVLVIHGDQYRGGFLNMPWYSIGRKAHSWRAGAIPEPFEYVMFGHFHTPVKIRLNTLTAWCNGTTESDNDFAREQLASAGFPSQYLFFIHKDGITAEYEVRLD